MQESITCPECNTPLRNVSPLTHGCYPCQRLYLMANGRLTDFGWWPVAEEEALKKLSARIICGSALMFLSFLAFVIASLRPEAAGPKLLQAAILFAYLVGCAWCVYLMISVKDKLKRGLGNGRDS